MLYTLSMQHETWTVQGAPVVGYRWEADKPRGAVLLAHGIGEYAQRYVSKFHGLIPALLSNNFSVYAYDQRGHGDSEGRRAVVDVNDLVDDHIKARETLRGLKVPLFLYGHSMGGLVTAASVARDQRSTAGVILSSPALLVGENEPAALKRLAPALSRVAPGLRVTEIPTRHLSRRKEEVSAYEADPRIYHGKIPVLTASTTLDLSSRLWSRYQSWQVPTLIFHGSADQVTDPRGSRRFAQTISSADKTHVEFEGGYHELLNDHASAEVLELILGWLRDHTD